MTEASWLWCRRCQRRDSQQYQDLKHEFSELSDVDIDVENWMYSSF